MRLDKALVERGLIQSRTQSEKTIAAGSVLVNGRMIRKASHRVQREDAIQLTAKEHYVARSAYKLKHALEAFTDISVKHKRCLDIGASTGGFTQVLLEQGARKVIAVDVGHGQMAPQIAGNPQVVLMEKINARYLTPENIGGFAEVITSDVSFISSVLIMRSIADCAADNADILVMVKPQFEVGKQQLPQGAIVVSEELREHSIYRVASSAISCKLSICGLCRNAVAGHNGNIEFFLWLKKRKDREPHSVGITEKNSEIMRSSTFSSILKEDGDKLKQWIKKQMG